MPLMNARYRNLIVIGCGPHYQKRYHDVLEKEEVAIDLLIDLKKNQESILEFFKNKKLKPAKTLFLEESYRNAISPQEIHSLISKEFDLANIDAVLLCTEPKVRKPYALWALQQGFSLFMDKPPCAFPSISKRDTLLADYEEIAKAAEDAKAHVVVSCERRANHGYVWLTDYLSHFIQEEKIPITSVDIHFANGNWVTPQEYFSQEYHPFKYGYGVLLHSGYHYIDLLTTFISLNKFENIEYFLKIICINPGDQLKGVEKYMSHRLSRSKQDSNSVEFKGNYENFGETEFLLIGQAKKEGQLLTNFSIKLKNTSVSKRTCTTPSLESSWRMRQEHIIMHLGFLASVNVICNPLNKLDPQSYPIEDFNLTIMHSPLLAKRDPIVRVTREDISTIFPSIAKMASLNKHAREWQLKEFLYGRDGNSSVASHRHSVQLLDLIYSQIHSGDGS